MLRLFACMMAFGFATLTWAAHPVKKPVKTSSKSKSGSGSKSSSSGRPATTWRNRQMAPTQQRYRQIQEALAAKGYLRPEDATGVWNSTSIDALKQFQTEQKL